MGQIGWDKFDTGQIDQTPHKSIYKLIIKYKIITFV